MKQSRVRTRQSDRQKERGRERETVQRKEQIREKQSREIEREGVGGKKKDCIAGVLHFMLGEGSGTHPLDQTVHGRMRQVVSFRLCRCTEESLFLSHKSVLCILFNSFSKRADAILTSWRLVKDRTLSFCLHLARSSM